MGLFGKLQSTRLDMGTLITIFLLSSYKSGQPKGKQNNMKNVAPIVFPWCHNPTPYQIECGMD